MEVKLLKKYIVILLLLNKNNAFKDAYSLTKALSRWFNIIDFNSLIDEMLKENLLENTIINQIGNYTITEKGVLAFNVERSSFEELLKREYPTQSEIISTLISNI